MGFSIQLIFFSFLDSFIHWEGCFRGYFRSSSSLVSLIYPLQEWIVRSNIGKHRLIFFGANVLFYSKYFNTVVTRRLWKSITICRNKKLVICARGEARLATRRDYKSRCIIYELPDVKPHGNQWLAPKFLSPDLKCSTKTSFRLSVLV